MAAGIAARKLVNELLGQQDALRRENKRLAEALRRLVAHLYAGSALGLTERELELLGHAEDVLTGNGGGYRNGEA